MKTQTQWNKIDWKTCELTLAENQNNLIIATKRGNTNEIKRLQYNITRSFAARALAVRKVTFFWHNKSPMATL